MEDGNRARLSGRPELVLFALDHAADAIPIFGRDARLFYVNDQPCKFLGCGRHVLLALRVAGDGSKTRHQGLEHPGAAERIVGVAQGDIHLGHRLQSPRLLRRLALQPPLEILRPLRRNLSIPARPSLRSARRYRRKHRVLAHRCRVVAIPAASSRSATLPARAAAIWVQLGVPKPSQRMNWCCISGP